MPKKCIAAQCKSKKGSSRQVKSKQEATTKYLRNRTVVSENKVTKPKKEKILSSAVSLSLSRSPIITRSKSRSIALQKVEPATSSMDSDSPAPVEDSLKRKHFTGEENKSLGESSKSVTKEVKSNSKAKKLKKSNMSNNSDAPKNELNDPPSISYEANDLRCNSNEVRSPNISGRSVPERNAESQTSSKNTNLSAVNKNVSKSNLSDRLTSNDNKLSNLDDNNDSFFNPSFGNSNFSEGESPVPNLTCYNENDMSVEAKMQKFETLYGKNISERKLITKSELQKSLESAMQQAKSCQSNAIIETPLDSEPGVSGTHDLHQVLKIKIEKDEESSKDQCKFSKSSNLRDSSSDTESLFKSPVSGASGSLGSAFHGITIKQEVEMPGYEEISNPFRGRRILLHDDLDGETVAQGTTTASNSNSRHTTDAADSIDGEIGRLQALMDSRRIPLSLFGALESRMQQLFQKSMGTATSSRAQQLVQELQSADDDEHQLQVLIEISQLLVMGNEDTLIGFPTKQLVPLLINLLLKEYNFELMNQACRALTYLMEALPRSSSVVVEAIPVLLNKIQVIQCIDVAEQALTALKMLSKWHSKPILQAKGVAACLIYLDFFSINAQRTAFAIISNCCQNLVLSEFILIQESLSTLSEWLTRQDEKSVESICLAFAGLVESFQKDPDSLLQIGSNTLLSNIQQLLVLSPPIISSQTFTSVIHMLAQMCSACSDIVVFLLKNNFSETLKYLLVGSSDNSKNIELIPRSPQELFELSYLICELMPCLPQDPIFSVDALVVEAKKKVASSSTVLMEWRDEAGIRHFRERQDGESIDEAQYGKVRLYIPDKASLNVAELHSMEQFDSDPSSSSARQPRWYVRNSAEKTAAPLRAEFFDDNVDLVTGSITVLFPVLYEMYCSSAGSAVKNKCIRALLRMIYFAPPEVLKSVLKYQNIARHVASMLASQEFRNVISALQISEILMWKLPTDFRVHFVREGVLHEIRVLSKIDVKSWQIENTPESNLPSTSNHVTPGHTSNSDSSDKNSHKSEGAQCGSSSSHSVFSASSSPAAKEDESSSTNVASKIRDVLKKRYMNIKRTFGAADKESGAMYSSTIAVTTESREKINTWIKEQAQKFDETYFNVDIINSHPVINVLNTLTEAVKSMESMDDCGLKPLKEIAEIVTKNDISSFELIHSGLVKKLMAYLSTQQGDDLPFGSKPLEDRLRTFLHVFINCPRTIREEFVPENINTAPLLNLLTKLGACVSHLEQFPVKVFDQSSIGTTGRPGSSIVKFFNMHQLKCLFQRHPSCTNLRQWHSGPVMVDPLASIQNVDRYLVNQGYGTIKDDDESESDLSYDDDSSDEDGGLVVADIRMDHGHGTPKLQFLIGKNVLPYNMTLYQAVRQYGNADSQSSNSQHTDGEYPVGYASVWLKTHTLWYRPVPPEEAESVSANDASTSHNSTGKKKSSSRSGHTSKSSSERSKLSKDKKDSLWESGTVPEVVFPTTFSPKLPGLDTIKDPSLEVIYLLRVIHGLSYHWGLLYKKNSWASIVPQTAFVNNDLTLKVNRQLQDPLAIMTRNIPPWLSHIAYNFPFLFPFETRHLLFYVTSFDRERALQRLIDTVPELTNSEKITPRLDKRKRTISRSSILKQAETILQDYGESKTMLEIQYKNEVGTGLGPTLEFYALVSKELQRSDLNMWHVVTSCPEGDFSTNYVHSPTGLFPMPLSRNTRSSSLTKICNKFKLLGKFLAKAIMDSRLIDIPLSLAFYKWMLNQEKYLSLSDLQFVDESLAQNIIKLEQMVIEKHKLENDKSLSSTIVKTSVLKITLDGCPVEDLSLDFTLPGYANIELKKGGKDAGVSIHNLECYLKLLKHWTMFEGVSKQMKAFKEGFDSVFSLNRLQVFYPEELAFIFCGSVYHQWDVQSLTDSCRADHGYTLDSQAIRFLFEILSSYNAMQQRQFIQFVTGSPRLPIGGLKSLSPPLTIVKKTSDDDSDSNNYLPSVMTCVNYLKLPDYTSIEIMREKLEIAISEGQLSFHLS
ncbi:E3 ubiquitin-protein ligase TRIP12 [Parasteatoda tepidariorum]|uniref:E3 ubiquitin-protein ligase TRIP12 n=1 Tax=Parasteatoda tepidariorum TaxID=114398 RepID=UPI00077FABF0|nr:E3 ubiquitin-protein ligase TRIP12 [Parasteatoda tepidariorum]XP_015911571.1 E3 ubiquitin-protein ligase TRIP12 [Parasteatoda tepidariorum]XP_015911572.1 E3 ubiquitin-protein ligase TRIP12 [Parasteatoda tepidariorum]XP_042907175.1 E3 ubiquitin-protein ligase TRIP12 [Parasteatoda tepidariorum]